MLTNPVKILIETIGNSLKPLIGKILLALGIGTITYSGFFILLNSLSSFFQLQLIGMPSDISAFLGIMKIDIAFTMIMSAVTARAALSGWSKLTDVKKSPFSTM